MPATPVNAVPENDTLLAVSDIHTYYGDSHILHGVSFDVRKGECLALLGRNGAGKTTTLRSIVGLTPVRAGQVSFRGEDITTLPPHRRTRLDISYVPEDRGIFPSLTVDEHLKVAAWAAGKKGLPRDDILDLFPRLGERLGNFGEQLSGGEQQMLAVGRALMANPDLLILDEPSEGLAPVIVDHITDTLVRIKGKGTTILLVEQNVGMALALADRLAILSQGRVVFNGTPGELKADPRIMSIHLGVS